MTTPRYTVNTTAGAPSYGQGERAPAQGTASGAQRTTSADADVHTVTLSLDTSAYASGDLTADTQVISSTAVDQAGGVAILDSITIVDEDAQGVAQTIIITSASTSMGTENSAPNISDANARNILGVVAVAAADFVTISGTKVATIRNIGLHCKAAAGSQALYVAVLNGSGTPTHTASGVRMQLGFRQA